jgi:hypothetical protein
MKTKARAILGLAALTTVTTFSAAAQQIILDTDAYSYPVGLAGGVSGGEFNAVTTPASYLGNYSPLTSFNIGNGVGFETFCVQVSLNFNVNQAYNYTLSQGIQLGSTAQPLTLGTAYLYYLFATASPTLGYDFVDPATRLADAGLLEAAIWDLEGGQSWSEDPFDPATNPYYNLALNNLGGLSGATAASDGAYGVQIMNLVDDNGALAQPQLVLTSGSVPDGGSMVALLGMGVGGLALFGRRCRKLTGC